REIVVATSNQEPVTWGEFKDWVQYNEEKYGKVSSILNQQISFEMERKRLDQYLKIRERAAYGLKSEVEKSNSYQRWLEPRREDELLLTTFYLEGGDQLRKAANEWENACRKYYQDHLQQWEMPETVSFRHIFVQLDEEASKISKRKARKRIKQIQNELRAGMPFEEAARQFSDSSPERRGVLIGPVETDRMQPALVRALRRIRPGEIEFRPIQTDHGYEIVLLEARSPKQGRSIEDVLPIIIEKVGPPPNAKSYYDNYLAEMLTQADSEAWLDRMRQPGSGPDTVLFRVGEVEWTLQDFVDYLAKRPRICEDAILHPIPPAAEEFHELDPSLFKTLNSLATSRMREYAVLHRAEQIGVLQTELWKKRWGFRYLEFVAWVVKKITPRTAMIGIDQSFDIHIHDEALLRAIFAQQRP
ncbi:MAG: peptidylprolyl isomerase, partial [Candidatus Hydrogenedentota bacterium]